MASTVLDLNAEELEPQGESTPEGEEEAPEYRLGVLAGCEYSPEPNAKLNDVQKNAFKDLCTKAAKRDYPARLIEVIQSWEKLEVSTPIATPGGWKTMGTLVSGDYVFGSNGRIVNVTAIQPITKEESYSILFDDGSNIVASADHTWNTQTLKERGAGKPAVERSTKELFNTQYRTHSIDLSPGLQTFDIELPIDPYLFGCWLGDGITSNGYVCGNRDDLAIVVQHFRDAGYMVSGPTKDGGKNSTVKNCQKIWVHGLARTIRSLKLGDKKRIPQIFLRASLSQRIALLQGLMDTDGWADGSGGCGWGQSPDKHSELIADFSELLSSLGVKHQFYPYSREHDGKTFNFHQTSFRPSFAAFRLKRKLASQKIPKENGRTRKVYIQKIEPVGERTVRCISVDAPDHLYLAGKSMIPTHNCALFYRGFQFLVPLRGGGWQVPGESTGYGPSMQMDLALLPTNIYSAQAQILISTLTRAIPTVRFEPQDGANDAEITAAESAEKFIKVIERNIDLMMVQNDAARYLYTDGRAIYWSRFEKDGQRFGWEEDDRPDDVVPENEPAQLPAESGQGGIPGLAPEGEEGPEVETPAAPTAGAPPEASNEGEKQEEPEEEAAEQPTKQPRTPRGQEVRTAHGKLEFKLIPMSANDLQGCDAVQYETEVDVSRAKGMFPWVADDIKGGSMGQSEGEIARLARQNVKLGMQSTYITSDSVADDVTIQRTWFRPSYFTHISDRQVRTSIISEFPDGALVVYAGETFCYARNESMEQSLALMQAFSGDGQNRNALGTSMMPIQKRVNNWLDLLNDSFIRTVPKKWMDSKAFDVNALKKQTNIPGDIGAFKRQPGVQVSELCWVEPQVTVSPTLAMFVKEYIGPISELMSGAYPALAGSSDLGGNDTKGGIEIQRNQALGRLGPTWHSIQNAEATSMKQLVQWAAKCRDKSINERIPGGRPVELEVNDLRGNILCFAETDESFPENHADKKAQLIEVFEDSAKTPQLQEVLYNASNLEFLQSVYGLSDLYIPQVASRNKQLGEFEILLKSAPVPNPKLQQAQAVVQQLAAMGADPQKLQMLGQQIAQIPPEICSIQIDSQVEDSETEAATCWQWLTSPEGRKSKRLNKQGYDNVRLHFLDHTQDAMQKKAAAGPDKAKPPAESINIKDLPTSGAIQLAKKGGIDLTQADYAEQEAKEAALKTAKSEPAPALAPAHPAAPPG